MCGRFTLTTTPDEVMEHYNLTELSFAYQPRFNIAPGQLLTAVISDGVKNRIGQLRWGLVPSWAQDEKIGYKMINAKSETVQEKPSFRRLFLGKRCLIPADSFYEWKTTASGKQPMRILLKNSGIFSLAGLYDTWISPQGQKIHSCTVITTTPNELVAGIHDRMPVILRPEVESIWLDPNLQNPVKLRSLLTAFPVEKMMTYPVSSLVNNVKNELPDCIAMIDTN